MKIYMILIFLHIIGDIFLQRNSILRKILKGKELSQLKRQNVKYLVLHAILYTVPVMVGLMYLQLFTVYKFFIVFVSHFIIDYMKCYVIVYKDMSLEFFFINLIDQLLHISILFIIVNL